MPGHDPFDVQYRIGSITKTMTAVLVLQLVRDGRIGLDDPASVGARRRRVRRPDAAHAARAQLGHAVRAGRVVVGAVGRACPATSWSAANDGSGAAFPAHQEFHYSNLGYALLGELGGPAARHDLVGGGRDAGARRRSA